MLYEFEEKLNINKKEQNVNLNDDEINEKYEKGEARIITEQGSVKLSLMKSVFNSDNYEKQPKYQRRITWDDKKRSKLIESFVMNVPVPPVFVYEVDFDKYQVMDGLQRISAIIDFYDNKYSLTDLVQWPELNGRYYNNLPQKIREGIDRRQLSVITLLKESSKTSVQEDLKRMVFERLNTGGVTLEDQEIRNALYGGPFNDLCIKLSEDDLFRKLWLIIPDEMESYSDAIGDYEQAVSYAKNNLYKRMYDVELVLRYFAMRHIEEYSGKLSIFMDMCLIKGNKYSAENLKILAQDFKSTIGKAYKIFGDKAFCQYVTIRGVKRWSAPLKMIYDVMMLALNDLSVDGVDFDVEKNVEILKTFYLDNEVEFDGKKQSKGDILKRKGLITALLKSML